MANTPGTPEDTKAAQQAAQTKRIFGTGGIPRKYTTPSESGKKYVRSEFVKDLSGLPETTGRHSERTDKSEATYVEFSPQLMEGIKIPLMDHFREVVRLQNLKIPDPTDPNKTIKAYDLIRDEGMKRDDPTLLLEQTMLSLITTDGQVDKDKINTLVNDPRFVEASMRILLRRKNDIFQAVGIREVVAPNGNRGDLNAIGRPIRTGVDQGWVNDVSTRVWDWLRAPARMANRDLGRTNGRTVAVIGATGGVLGIAGGALGAGAGLVTGAAGGIATGLVAGSIPGAIGLGIVGGIEGFKAGAAIGAVSAEAIGLGAGLVVRSSRGGLQIRFDRDPSILQAAATNSPIRDRLLYGIDPTDFQISADGRRTEINPYKNQPGQVLGSTNLENSLKQAVEIEALKGMYAEALGIDPAKVEAEDQYIHAADRIDWRTASAPQTGEKIVQDIHETFRTLLQNAEQQTRNMNADPARAGLPPIPFVENYTLRNNLYRQAEARVIQGRLESILNDPKKDKTRRTENLDKKAKSFDPNTTEGKARTRALNEEKTQATADKQMIDDENKNLTDYQAELKAVSAAEKELDDLLKSFKIVPSGGKAASPTSADDAIKALTAVIEDSAATDKIQGLKNGQGLPYADIESIAAGLENAHKDRERKLAAAESLPLTRNTKAQDIRSATAEAQIESANQEYKRKEQALTERSQALTELRDNISKKQKEIQAANDKIKDGEKVKAGTEVLQRLGRDYATLVRDIGITEDTLRTGDINQITREINRAARTGNTNAWGDAENSLEERQRVVLNAVAEQRAVDALATTPNRAALTSQYRGPLLVGITEHELRYMSNAELLAQYHARAPEAVRAAADILTRRQAERAAADTRVLGGGGVTGATPARAAADTAFSTAQTRYTGLRVLPPTDPTRIAAREVLERARQARAAARAAEAAALQAQAEAVAREAEASRNVAAVTAAANRLTAIPPLSEADLGQAKQWAREILSQHVEALNGYSEEIERDINDISRRINVDTAQAKQLGEQVQRTKEIIGAWQDGTLQTRATSMMLGTDGEPTRAALIDTDPRNVTLDRYTPAEIASRLSPAELTLLQMITGYDRAADREQRFNEVKSLLTDPRNFTALVDAIAANVPDYVPEIVENPALGVAAAPEFTWTRPTNPNELMRTIAPLIQRRLLSSDNMYRILGTYVLGVYQNTMLL